MDMTSIYRALPSSQFRLLRIRGSEEAGSVQCTLEQHDLSNPPGYSAVSYTWGEAEHAVYREQTSGTSGGDAVHEIHVDGQPFIVTQNLYDLLCEFSNSYPHDVNYWIDAICINQGDLEEKTQQVNAIDKIYSRAFSVVVWLGKENIHTAKVIDMTNRLSRLFTDEYNVHGHCRKYIALDDPLDEDQMHTIGLSDVSRSDWLAFIAFYQRRWFFRVWTVQEAALAQRVLVRVGAFELEWFHIIACSRLIADTELHLALVDLGQRHYQQHDIVFPAIAFLAASLLMSGKVEATGVAKSLYAWYAVDNVHASNAALLDLLLRWLPTFQSTDARDRVFAVLGMLNMVAQNHTQLPFPLAADYSRTTAEVYTDTMTYVLNHVRTLTVLARVTPPSLVNVAELPSWVIDFSGRGCTRFLDLHRISQKNALFDASAGMRKGFHIDGHRLYLHTLTIANVIRVGDSNYDLTHRRSFEQTAALALSLFETRRDKPHDFIDRIWMAMTCDLNDFRDSTAVTDEQVRGSFRATLMYMRLDAVVNGLEKGRTRADIIDEAPFQNQLGEIDESGTMPRKGQVEEHCERIGLYENKIGRIDVEARDELDRDARLFRLLIKQTIVQRRLFLTDGGHIGLGCVDCQPGDELCVIADGGRTPFVVRQKASDSRAPDYTLLGEAYVREIMHGEAVEHLESQGRCWQKICLV